MMRTLVVEMGTGVDLHGQDATKAAIRAVRNAFQHVSLPGVRQVAGVTDMAQMVVDVVIGAPPEAGSVDVEQVKAQFPYGTVNVKVQSGGLAPAGEADPIIMVNALMFVRVP
jgi:uncharacterized protein (TIGR02058 family)